MEVSTEGKDLQILLEGFKAHWEFASFSFSNEDSDNEEKVSALFRLNHISAPPQRVLLSPEIH